MRKLDKLTKDVEEMKPKDKFRLSFDHLSDEELEKELENLTRFHYESELFDHLDWTDEEIYQKMDDDLIAIYEEEAHTEKEVREFRESLKSDWSRRPKKSEYAETIKRHKEYEKYFKEKMERDNPGATIKCREK